MLNDLYTTFDELIGKFDCYKVRTEERLKTFFNI